MAEALEPQGELAKTHERAFAALLRVAAGETGGKTVEINNVNAQVNETTTISTSQLIQNDQRLLQKGRQLMARLGLVLLPERNAADATIEEGSASGGS